MTPQNARDGKTRSAEFAYHREVASDDLALNSLSSVFQEDGLVAEIADQVERYPERDDVLEEKQAQKTHIPYAVNGSGRAGCSDNHCAGDKEHHCSNEATYNTGFRLEIACGNQLGCGDLSDSDQV